MTPPKFVKVLGRKWPVKVVDRDASIPGAAGSDDARGITDLEKETIHVYAAAGIMSDARAKETLLHEALHAILHVGRLGTYLVAPPADAEGNDKVKDEAFVDALAPHLLQFLRDNPVVIAYLTERVK
jgi:hypothetical protein